ncbi:MAG: phosphoribosylglycinamide formyltransferase [Candidatus Omnitrophota bacterium]
MNIAVFVSGNGSNLQALINARTAGLLAEVKIVLVVSDQPKAFAVERAKKAGIKTFVLEAKGFKSREDYDKKIIEQLQKEKIESIVLAGFMRILGGIFIEAYKGRILNIHPALLPSFKGIHGIRDAFEYGVKTTGVTVHFVDKEMDAGPVILQESVEIKEDDTLESLEERVHKVEHRLYPKALSLFAQGRLKIEGRKVRILK